MFISRSSPPETISTSSLPVGPNQEVDQQCQIGCDAQCKDKVRPALQFVWGGGDEVRRWVAGRWSHEGEDGMRCPDQHVVVSPCTRQYAQLLRAYLFGKLGEPEFHSEVPANRACIRDSRPGHLLTRAVPHFHAAAGLHLDARCTAHRVVNRYCWPQQCFTGNGPQVPNPYPGARTRSCQ